MVLFYALHTCSIGRSIFDDTIINGGTVTVTDSGYVVWVISEEFQTSCNVSTSLYVFPFDTHTCSVIVSGWLTAAHVVNYTGVKIIDTTDMLTSIEWQYIDYKVVDGDAIVFTHRGRVNTGTTLQTWAEKAIDLGAGELFINSIDRDGTAIGYDIKNINALVDRVNIPVIACGGAGHQSHFLECYSDTTVSAVAAGNIFHFTENANPRAKQFLRLHRADVR